MFVVEVTSTILQGVPLARTIARSIRERGLEVKVEAGSDYVIQYGDPTSKWPPAIYADLRITLTNHRTDRPERIIGCHLELKRKVLFLWSRTILSVLLRNRVGNADKFDIELPAMSSPTSIEVVAFGPGLASKESAPKYSDLMLVLQLVGPIRRMERRLTKVTHDGG